MMREMKKKCLFDITLTTNMAADWKQLEAGGGCKDNVLI